MNVPTTKRGRVAVIGAGPAGMATALSVHQAGHDVVLLERYPQARPAGNILNLWPAPIKALGLLGVDINDLGSPCRSEFRAINGRRRVLVNIPDDIVRDYGGGFIGLLRPDLYERMLAALPPGVLRLNRHVERFEQDESAVRLYMTDGELIEVDVLIGADGIDSLVRRTLWGDTPKRDHNLHIFGGYTFDESVEAQSGLCVLTHGRTVQGSWTSIRSKGRDGFQWWVLGAHDAKEEFTGDLHATATAMGTEFPSPLPQLIEATSPEQVQRWLLRDRKPLKQWSQGRVTIVGDAAHPTSPYAAYGAGMATEDGYFIGRRLAGVDLSDTPRSAPPWTTLKHREGRTLPAKCNRPGCWGSCSTTRPLHCVSFATLFWTTVRFCKRSPEIRHPVTLSRRSPRLTTRRSGSRCSDSRPWSSTPSTPLRRH